MGGPVLRVHVGLCGVPARAGASVGCQQQQGWTLSWSTHISTGGSGCEGPTLFSICKIHTACEGLGVHALCVCVD